MIQHMCVYMENPKESKKSQLIIEFSIIITHKVNFKKSVIDFQI